MDKVIILDRHKQDFTYVADEGVRDTEGTWIKNESSITFRGALLPLTANDLQRIERGDVVKKSKKVYTETDLSPGQKFIDNRGVTWEIFEELEYDYIANLHRFVVFVTEEVEI